MIRVSKVIVEQYSHHPSRQQQLPSEGEAPLHPIFDNSRPNKEHLYPPMMNMKVSVSILCHKILDNIYIY